MGKPYQSHARDAGPRASKHVYFMDSRVADEYDISPDERRALLGVCATSDGGATYIYDSQINYDNISISLYIYIYISYFSIYVIQMVYMYIDR